MRTPMYLRLLVAAIACLAVLACMIGYAAGQLTGQPKDQPVQTGIDIAQLTDQDLAAAFGDISLEAAGSVRKLAGRFTGASEPVTVLNAGALNLADEAAHRRFYKTLAQAEQALSLSNAGDNLAAPPVPTGDELFDRYALAVDARIREANVGDQALASAAAVPDGELAGWERDFGQDARYWELRYLCAAMAGEEQATRHLTTAIDNGVATANTVLVLYCAKRSALLAGASTRCELAEHAHQMAENADEMFGLLDTAEALGPDEAWTHYLRAFLYFETGAPASAYRSLQVGNSAASNVYPVPYPWGLVHHGPVAGTPAGSAAVDGAVMLHIYDRPFIDCHCYKRHLKAQLEEIDSAADLPKMEDWHQFICRYGASRADEFAHCAKAEMLEMHLFDHGTAHLAMCLTTEQLDVLNRLRRCRHDIYTAFKHDCEQRDCKCAANLFGTVGCNHGRCVFEYLDHARTTVSLANNQWTPLASKVHYDSLKLPEELADYQPLTLEDIVRTTGAKREARQVRYTGS